MRMGPDYQLRAQLDPSLATTGSSWSIPGMAIVLFVLAWNLVGDALRDILDPPDRQPGLKTEGRSLNSPPVQSAHSPVGRCRWGVLVVSCGPDGRVVTGRKQGKSGENPRSSQMRTSRFVVGLFLIIAAVLLFVFGGESYATAGAIALGVLGLASIAISRKR